MRVLIDGYNLVWGAHFVGRGAEEGTLRGSRLELLDLLARTLPTVELPEIMVVFDAAEAPPGLPTRARYEGIRVRFAAEYDDADALLEEYIQQHTAPRQLTVVSSDHRVQRAAKRRRAVAVDSEDWIRQLWQQYRKTNQHHSKPSKPSGPLLPRERDWWLAQFQQDDGAEELPATPTSRSADRKLAYLLSSLKRRTRKKQAPLPSTKTQTTTQKPKKETRLPTRSQSSPPMTKSGKDSLAGYNPFPPNYADDLLQTDQQADWDDVDHPTDQG